MSQTNVTSQDFKAKQVGTIDQPASKDAAMRHLQMANSKQRQSSQITNVQSRSTLQQIQSQKSTIVHELSRIDQAIRQVKGQGRSKSILRRRQEIAKDKQAHKHALSFIAQQKIKKQEFLNKKKEQEMKASELLKQKVEQSNRVRQMQESMLREQKKRAISIRISQNKSKRDEMKSIQQESNLLINRLIKQEQKIRKMTESPTHIDQDIKVVERRPHVDFAELEKHQQEYLLRKEELSKKKERSVSISYPIKKYGKNRWAEKLEEQEDKLKEQERLKQLEKRMNMEKRQKYGELISSFFVKKKRTHTQHVPQSQPVSKSKSIYVVPTRKMPKAAIPNIVKAQKAQSKMLQMKRLINSQYTSIRHEQNSQSPQQRQKKMQQRKLRRQTSERIKKNNKELLQKAVSEPQPKYQSKFQNYLGQIKLKKREDNEWSVILKNESLSHQQKYTQLLRNAATLENKAKLKQQLKENHDEVVDLYLDSIQVKLAILQSI